MKRGKSHTITEASKILKISRQSTHEAIQKGHLKAKKGEVRIVRTAWLISDAALKEYQARYSRKRPKKKIT